MASYCQGRCTDDPTDHAGHIIGHRFVQDQGLQNLFPQNAKLNTGAYKTLENELADWIEAGGEIKLNVKLHEYENGRPAEIEVSYEVFDSVTGDPVYKNTKLFNNDNNQSFSRISSTEIKDTLDSLRKDKRA